MSEERDRPKYPSRFRTVCFLEGVRVPYPMMVDDVAVIPFPTVAVTRYLADLLSDPLEELGFHTGFAGPALVASGSASRPVAGLVIEAERTDPVVDAAGMGEVLDLFRILAEQVRTALVFAYGGEARVLAQIVESSDDGGASWRPLTFAHGGPGYIRNELAALSPDGWSPPMPPMDEVVGSLRQRPIVGMWCSLFASSVGEPRWDVRILRLWAVLETIAKRVIPGNAPVVDEAGERLTAGGRTVEAKDARGAVYLLLRSVRDALAIPDEVAVCHADHDLWSEVDIWLSVRNGVAHDGGWPSPNSSPTTLKRLGKSIQRAARPGGAMEEGLDRYAQHLKAWVEAVLLAAALGHFDADLAPPTGN